MELVIIEDPARTTAVPVEKLHLSFPFREENGPPRKARTRKQTRSTRAAKGAVIVLARPPRSQKARKAAGKAAETGRLRRKLRPARAKT